MTLAELIQNVNGQNLEYLTADFKAQQYKSRINLAINLDDSLLAYYYIGFPARILREAIPAKPAADGTPPARAVTENIRSRALFERSTFMIKAMTENRATWYKAVSDDLHLQIVRQIREDFYQLYFLERIIKVTEQTLSTLDNLLDSSQERYAVGELRQKDVFQVQTEKSRILIQLLALRQQHLALTNNLNYLAGRDLATPLHPVLDTDLTHTGLKAVPGSLPELTAFMQVHRPLVKGYKALVETFGIMRLMIPMYYNMILRRDALLEVESGLRATRTELADFQSKTTAELVTEYGQLKTYQEQAQLYGNLLLPQTRQILAGVQSDYEVGRAGLEGPLQALITLNRYQVEYYQTLANYQASRARLEAASAMPLF